MNDSPSEPPLKDPEDNPWYLLATLHGVPSWNETDKQARNQRDWNRYYASVLTDKDRVCLTERFPELDIEPLDQNELEAIKKAFRDRAGGRLISMPNPGDDADFRSLKFCNRAMFKEYLFIKVDFSYSEFYNDSNFNNCIFYKKSNFSDTKFAAFSYFIESTFFQDADFMGSDFNKSADFRNSVFFASAGFSETTFSWSANFSHVNFSAGANFGEAKFFKVVRFNNVTFSVFSNFIKVKFHGSANFNDSTFSTDSNFSKATFSNETTFINAEMRCPTSFQECAFNTPPRFAGSKMHQGTVWLDAKWPKVPKAREDAAHFIQAYEPLKAEMDRLKKHEDELFFFTKELECRRARDGIWKSLHIAFYGALCGYGGSFILPLFWLLAIIVLGAAAHLPALNCDVLSALGISAANTFGSLGVRKEFVGAGPAEGWLKLIGAVQMVVGAILLFLTGLCLRNRLRMK